MVGWNNELTFQFIERYQNEPCIWNPKHKHHKDKIKVYDAWLRIANAMGVPDVADVKKKKESLMTAFRLNHKKVIASRKSGEEIFKPVWVYYDTLATFMADVYECTSTLTSEEHIEPNGNTEGDGDNTIRALHKRPNRFINDILKKSSSPVRKHSSGHLEKRKHTPVSKFSKIRSHDERNSTNSALEPTDEFQIYGLYVASQLTSLSEKQSLIAREKVNINSMQIARYKEEKKNTIKYKRK
ncbi:uncharacterized protein LOC134647403 [Cydia amplana]|uniref:uncharacterized protein LOC134647403 n=1 Tax=Cydia amplana TaxID=1869771 RepID=UPI002FE60B64